MLNEQQLNQIANGLTQALKDRKPLSDYNKKCVALWDRVKVHATENFPESLISKRHPSETDDEFNYRKDTYQAITSAYWWRALGSVSRVWQNFSVNYPDEEQEQYFEGNYPVYNSFQYFFESVVTPHKINDPNTILTLRPFIIPTVEIEGETVADDSERVDPFCVLFPSVHNVDYVSGSYFIGLLDLKSEVTDGNRTVKEGKIFEIYDDTAIYRLIQKGKKIDYEFELTTYYIHNLNFLPCWALGGMPFFDEERIIYKSYFSPAIPHLNNAVLNNSTLDGVTSKHAYPIRAYLKEDCENTACNDGKVVNDEGELVDCGVCGGSGVSGFSPFRDFTRYVNPRFDEQLPFPGIDYISPPLEPMEFLDSKIDKDIRNAFELINIDVSNQPNGQTATEVKLDREELFSFLLNISAELSGLYSKAINAAGQMRYLNDWQNPQIISADEFTIRSSADLTQEIKTASESNLPDVVVDKLNIEYAKRRFSSDTQSELYFHIRSQVDALRNKSDSEISSILATGSIKPYQVTLHYNFDLYVSEFLNQDQEFLSSDTAKDQLIAKAQADTQTTPSLTERINTLRANTSGIN